MSEEAERNQLESGRDVVIDVEPEAADEPVEREEAAKVFCPQCGTTMGTEQRYCSNCGWDAEQPEKPPPGPPTSPRDLGPLSNFNRLTVLLLCILIGWLGAHRFYVGRPASGLVWLVTLGFLGIGFLYDIVLIATGEFRDGEEKRVWHWR